MFVRVNRSFCTLLLRLLLQTCIYFYNRASKKTIPICKNSWVLGFLVQEWAISHIYRYAKNIPRKYHKQKESSASGYRPLTFI